jgi:hypothetical protein
MKNSLPAAVPAPGKVDLAVNLLARSSDPLADFETKNYPPRPLSPEELAEWLGCTRRFLEYEVVKGNLKVRRITKRLTRFLPGDVARWLERGASMLKDEQKEAASGR